MGEDKAICNHFSIKFDYACISFQTQLAKQKSLIVNWPFLISKHSHSVHWTIHIDWEMLPEVFVTESKPVTVKFLFENYTNLMGNRKEEKSRFLCWFYFPGKWVFYWEINFNSFAIQFMSYILMVKFRLDFSICFLRLL